MLCCGLMVVGTVAQAATVRAHDVDVRPAIVLAKLNGQAGASVSFSDDGEKILTSGMKSARIWDGITFKPITAPLPHGSGMVYAAFDLQGDRVITTGDDNVAKLWSVRTRQPTFTFTHQGRVHFATFSPSGKTVITCGQDGRARLWDSTSGRLLLDLHHPAPVRFATFPPKGDKIITSTGTTRIWDAGTGRELIKRPDTGPNDNGDMRWIRPVAVSPDGTHVASIFTWLGVNWDPTTGNALFAIDTRAIGAWPIVVGYTSQGKLVTASVGLQVWERGNEDKIQTSIAPGSGICDFAFTPDGKRVLIAATDDSSGIWDIASSRQVQEIRGMRVDNPAIFPAQREVPAIAMSKDGRRIAVGFASTDTTTIYELPAPLPSAAEK